MMKLKRTVIIEATFFFLLSIITVLEALRLTFIKDPAAIYDPIGPGPYLLVLGTIMIIGSIFYFVSNCKRTNSVERKGINKRLIKKLISTILNCALYLFLISLVGYLISTLVFFFLQFRIEGITSWVRSVMLTLVVSITYYLIFAKYCSLIFPRGILFK